MFKATVVALGLSLIACVGNVTAAEMAMPTGDFAHSGRGSGDAETTAATHTTGAAGATPDAATPDGDTTIAIHDRMQPDNAGGARIDTAPLAVRGTDATTSAADTSPHKARHNAHWQSLLPGVMK